MIESLHFLHRTRWACMISTHVIINECKSSNESHKEWASGQCVAFCHFSLSALMVFTCFHICLYFFVSYYYFTVRIGISLKICHILIAQHFIEHSNQWSNSRVNAFQNIPPCFILSSGNGCSFADLVFIGTHSSTESHSNISLAMDAV